VLTLGDLGRASSELDDHPHTTGEVPLAEGQSLKFYQRDSKSVPYVLADIAVDEDFVAVAGREWELEALRAVEGSNELLAAVGLRLKVSNVQRWKSDDIVQYISAHLDSAQRQANGAPGHVFLAITGQSNVKFDGWAREPGHAAIVEFNAADPLITHSLIAHEVGHLLGAEHHEDDEHCTDEGCIMNQEGYIYLEKWCEHHQELIRGIVVTGLATTTSL
jgi:hypothetical protein